MLSLLGSLTFLPELFTKVQEKFFSLHGSDLSSFIYAIVRKNPQFLMEKSRIDSWKEVLAALLRYTSKEECNTLCRKFLRLKFCSATLINYIVERLGERLETELNGVMLNNSIICYIISGSIDKAAQVWHKRDSKSTTNAGEALASTIEKIVLSTIGLAGNGHSSILMFDPHSGKLLRDFAQYLASQGEVGLALRYLSLDMSVSNIFVLVLVLDILERLGFGLSDMTS